MLAQVLHAGKARVIIPQMRCQILFSRGGADQWKCQELLALAIVSMHGHGVAGLILSILGRTRPRAASKTYNYTSSVIHSGVVKHWTYSCGTQARGIHTAPEFTFPAVSQVAPP